MNEEIAVYLLSSLIDRVDKNQVGTISAQEREALSFAKDRLLGARTSEPTAAALAGVNPVQKPAAMAATAAAAPKAPEVKAAGQGDGLLELAPLFKPVSLNLSSLKREAAQNAGLMMCLDFGTAMSKAFATTDDDEESLSLALGVQAGKSGFPVPSSVFIADDGRVYFGFEALERSEGLVRSRRTRFDSLKGVLSLRSQGDLDADVSVLSREMNPTTIRMTEGGLLRIYLAFLTDLALEQLTTYSVGKKGTEVGRYVKRRFAHPCWSMQDQKQWAEPLMRKLLAEAQILADTFSGKWVGGIDIREIESAVSQVRTLARRPDYIIEGGVPEPVAVASAALADGSTKREPFMVVDVGAGTTDFGLFVIREDGAQGLHKVFQVPDSISMIKQAGDKVDNLLLFYISEREKIDREDSQGRLVLADLRRQIRGLKERLFDDGTLEYVLADSTTGKVERDAFLDSAPMRSFRDTVLKGFKEALASADDTWLQWLARQGLKVVLTGGGARMPPMQELASGVIEVRGHRIERYPVDPTPVWLAETIPDLVDVYPQMAVAIGGAAPELPEVAFGPQTFAGGAGPSNYGPGRMQVTGT
jgi:molecular chaperone HscA